MTVQSNLPGDTLVAGVMTVNITSQVCQLDILVKIEHARRRSLGGINMTWVLSGLEYKHKN